MSELRVFTSRYHNPNVVLCNLEKVGITLYSPRFGLKYRVAANVRDLAPDPYMLGLSKAKGHVAFAREYRKKLEKLGAPAIQQKLSELQGDAAGVVLLCYEDLTRGDETCHRTILADWLKVHAGLVVEELPDPGRKTPKRKKGQQYT